MTPVDQRILAARNRGDGHNGLGIAGDCMRACMATVLELPYEQVPHVVHYGDGRSAMDDEATDPLTEKHGGLWWRRLRRWMRARGQDVACYLWDQPEGHLELRTADGEGWSGPVILGGRSPRGDFLHVVVGVYGWNDSGPFVEVTHDPHPSRAGLSTILDVTVVVDPYDPPPLSTADEREATGVIADGVA